MNASMIFVWILLLLAIINEHKHSRAMHDFKSIAYFVMNYDCGWKKYEFNIFKTN